MTKPTEWLCAQRLLRSAWASTQSDQRLRCALGGLLRTQAFFMRTSTAKTLIGCPGWSESSLGAHSFCWYCHVAAQVNSTSLSDASVGSMYLLCERPRFWYFVVEINSYNISYELSDFIFNDLYAEIRGFRYKLNHIVLFSRKLVSGF